MTVAIPCASPELSSARRDRENQPALDRLAARLFTDDFWSIDVVDGTFPTARYIAPFA